LFAGVPYTIVSQVRPLTHLLVVGQADVAQRPRVALCARRVLQARPGVHARRDDGRVGGGSPVAGEDWEGFGGEAGGGAGGTGGAAGALTLETAIGCEGTGAELVLPARAIVGGDG